MTNTTKAKLPDIELATKDWVLKEMIDTEKRIEKAFHDQTQYLSRKHDELIRWMFGLIMTMTVAILVAVLFGR